MPIISSVSLGQRRFGFGGAADGPTFEHITTTTLTNNITTSVVLSSIPQTYTHLQLRISAKMYGSTGAYLYMSTNISGQTYYEQGMESGFSSFSSYNQTVASRYERIGLMANNSYNNWTSFIIDVNDYSNSSKKKAFKMISGYKREGADAHSYMNLNSGFQNVTTNITSLTLFNSADAAFQSGTTFSLYGIKVS